MNNIRIIDGSDASNILSSDTLRRSLIENLAEGTDDVQAGVHGFRDDAHELLALRIEGIEHSLETVLQNEKALVATLDEVPVGMAAITQVRGHEDVFEIGRVTVLPEGQGKRISSMLMQTALEKIRTEFPHATVLITSKNPRIHSWAHSQNFTVIGMEQHERYWGSIHDASDIEYAQKMEAAGWQSFRYSADNEADA